MTAVPAATTVFFGQPDNFSLYQPLGAAAHLARARAPCAATAGRCPSPACSSASPRSPATTASSSALALAIVFLWDRWRAWRIDRRAASRPIPWWGAVASFGLFLVAVGPWWLRQLSVFGTISPSSSNGKILFIRTVTEMNSIDTPATLQYFLGQGVGPLVASRILGFIAAVGNYSIIVLSFVLTPFLFIGGWMQRRSIHYRVFFIYAALLFAASGLLFAVHVPLGTFLHSAVALIPHTYILVLEGVAACVVWIAARRPKWNEAEATRFFLERDGRHRVRDRRPGHLEGPGGVEHRAPRPPAGRDRPRRPAPRRAWRARSWTATRRGSSTTPGAAASSP